MRNATRLASQTITQSTGPTNNTPTTVATIPITTTPKILNKKHKPNPLEVLVQAASVLNPKQFELPKALTMPLPFPGTDKSKYKSKLMLMFVIN